MRNREIKFRARNAGVPRCWIYGYFIIVGGSYYIINNNGQFQVIADSQNQFTGRFAKNNKEVYEEDIIKLPNTDICVIQWVECRFTAIPLKKNNRWGIREYVYWDAEEIIGNMTENPELMKD